MGVDNAKWTEEEGSLFSPYLLTEPPSVRVEAALG